MLADILERDAFVFLMIMTRFAPLMMLMPIIGEKSVSQRFRVVLAAAFAVLLTPVVETTYPPMPPSGFGLAWLIFKELTIGMMLGMIGRMLMGALHVAGTIIAFQVGLAAAQNFDPSQGNQTALVASTMAIIGITMLVVSDMHHMIIRAAAHSYVVFSPVANLAVTDFTRLIIYYVGQSFNVGMHMAAPFMVYAVIYNTGLGLINRLVPRIQVFFISLPLNVLVGLLLLSVLLPSMMMLFLDHFGDMLQSYMG